MYIKKLIVKNFKALKGAEVDFNENLNIIVGDNETGKSTLLEAVNLVLSGQINNRNILYDVNPYLFNNDTTQEYFDDLSKGNIGPPPALLIEAYFNDDDSLQKLRGTNNTLRENCPGLVLSIEFDDGFNAEYTEFIKAEGNKKTIPVEYYKVSWLSFAGNPLTTRSKPVNATMVDTSLLRYNDQANKYISKIINDYLTPTQRVNLSLSYRNMKELFGVQPTVQLINEQLAKMQGEITDKELSVSMDMSSRYNWESSITAHLNDIPISYAGKGEQSSVKMKLAMEASDEAHVFLIEEPENHLSYSNMNKLIENISRKGTGKQIIIATHSSFVLNKLGIENVILFNRDCSMRINDLSPETKNYFMKLPGHDTLRLILSNKAILVEGPSDELIVQRAFIDKYGVMPLENGVDVISVQSLAFKRFLEIGKLLKLNVQVVTDNDGNVQVKIKDKYKDYLDEKIENIKICYDEDENFPTLEPQLLKSNSLALFNKIFNTDYASDEELLAYMENNKTKCALMIFDSQDKIEFPQYIEDAIKE